MILCLKLEAYGACIPVAVESALLWDNDIVLENTHLQAVGMAISQEWDATRSFGAVGIICCRFVDANGQGIVKSPEERLIAATLGNLRKPKKKLLVVCGSDRAQATFVAINGGLVTHLCVGQGLAEELTHL